MIVSEFIEGIKPQDQDAVVRVIALSKFAYLDEYAWKENFVGEYGFDYEIKEGILTLGGD